MQTGTKVVGEESEGWWQDPGGRQPSGFRIVIFIAIVFDGKINVMLRQRVSIISVTATMWNESKAER